MRTPVRILLAAALVAAAVLPSSLPAAAPETVPAPAAGARPQARGPQPGEMAPDFTVLGPDGAEVKLSDFRGKVVLLDIWATWCGPCVAAMPHNSELAERHAGDGLVVLAVCASDSRANYDGWVQRNRDRYRFLTAHDPAGSDFKASVFRTQWGVSLFPSIFVIGRDGSVIGRTAGGGAGENPGATQLLAKAGLPVRTDHLPPEKESAAKPVPAPMPAAAPAPGTRASFGSLAAGAAVPDFTVTTADGAALKLSSLRGRTAIVAFFSNAERGPEEFVVRAAARYAEQGVSLLAVGSAMERERFDTWATAAKPAYAAGWDPAGRAWGENISHMVFGVGMYPAFAVIDREGRLVGGSLGMGAGHAARLHGFLQQAGIQLAAEDVLPPAPAAMPAAAIRPGPTPATPPMEGKATLGPGAAAPDFTMVDVDGNAVRLSDYAGKIVILDFWATWCGPCISSFPHTQKIAAHYRDQGVVVLASGTSDTADAFRAWIPKNRERYPDMVFVYDPRSRGTPEFEERASSKLYGVTGIPTQFVIGRDGKIAATIVGNGGAEDARTEAALATLGVKVDEAVVARGRQQLEEAARREAELAVAAAEAAKNPPPPFRTDFGKLKAGETVPDVAVETVEGTAGKLSDFARGKVTVLGLWSASGGPPEPMLTLWEDWSRRYRERGVVFLGIAGFGAREAFDQWRTAQAGRFSFPVAFDNAGTPPRPEKPLNELSDEERKAFSEAQSAFLAKTVPMLIGGIVAPVPTMVVVDAEGRLVGWSAGFGPNHPAALGNLLLRAGVSLDEGDRPARVYTVEETRPAPPPEPVSLIAAGTVAPDFVSKDVDGREWRLADFQGKVVVLDFWATWCGPCMAAMPKLQKIHETYAEQGVVVFASCTSDSRAAFERWVPANREKFTFLFAHDAAERGPDRASRKLYGVSGIPTQFVIGRDGRIVEAIVGYEGERDRRLERALAKAGIAVDLPPEPEQPAAAPAGPATVPALGLTRPPSG